MHYTDGMAVMEDGSTYNQAKDAVYESMIVKAPADEERNSKYIKI